MDITAITRHRGFCLLHTSNGATVRVGHEKARVLSIKLGLTIKGE